ncbi:hypothetical protein QNI19_05905, partial [Cytophagaceae bacterium DM2B3-1]
EAKKLEVDFPAIAAFLREAANSSLYRGKLLKSIQNLYKNKGDDFIVFIEFYKNDPVLYPQLVALKNKDWEDIYSDLETIFKGTEFNAHHIIPANLCIIVKHYKRYCNGQQIIIKYLNSMIWII